MINFMRKIFGIRLRGATHFHAVLCCSAALCLSVVFGAMAFAEGKSAPRQTLENSINAIVTELKKPEFKDEAQKPVVLKRVEDLVHEIFDFTELSKRTVGAAWRNFSEDQQKRFVLAFTDLLRATYIGRIEGYNGEEVAYTGETSSTSGDKVEINTSILVDNKDVLVNYRMLLSSNGAWKVYDVIVEGVSLVQNYRTQFQDMLAKGDAEELIALVLKKSIEVKEQKK